MSDNKDAFVTSAGIPTDGFKSLIAYDGVVEYLNEMIADSHSYPCPVCLSLDKYIHTYTDTAPYHATIFDHIITDNFNAPDPKFLFTVGVQCQKCGRLDFFNAATLIEWLKSRKQEVSNASDNG